MKFLLAIFLMTSATILASVQDYLAPLVADNNGLLSIAETEEDALYQLNEAPERWRVILCMDGDKAIETLNPGGWVEGRVMVFVQAPKGMEAVRGRNMIRESARGTPAFFTRLHWTILKLRGLKLEAADIDSRGMRYHSWEWLRYDGQAAFRTAKANFDLCFAHDDPATDPDGSAPVVLPSPSPFRIVASLGDYYAVSINGIADGRVPRFEPGLDDPTGTATGYAITGIVEGAYAVAFDGIPHGRIPRFEPA